MATQRIHGFLVSLWNFTFPVGPRVKPSVETSDSRYASPAGLRAALEEDGASISVSKSLEMIIFPDLESVLNFDASAPGWRIRLWEPKEPWISINHMPIRKALT